ncbi:MAG: helix-turn-helix transcriptional regulator [Lachnospiraceae bacterium]|nr:helix-turn-helix transcriptional regulator [Lachnospiraceae bacterium]
MIHGLGERLQLQRMNMKLTQKEVAITIGVSPSVLSNYENGERVPSIENLMALAGLYRCSTDYLLGISKTENIQLDTSMLDTEQKRLLQYFLHSLKSVSN